MAAFITMDLQIAMNSKRIRFISGVSTKSALRFEHGSFFFRCCLCRFLTTQRPFLIRRPLLTATLRYLGMLLKIWGILIFRFIGGGSGTALTPKAFLNDSIVGQAMSNSGIQLISSVIDGTLVSLADRGLSITETSIIFPIALMLRLRVLMSKLPVPNKSLVAAADSFIFVCSTVE